MGFRKAWGRAARRVRAVEALRTAAAKRDMPAVEARLLDRRLNPLIPDANVMIELLVDEDSSIAEALWDAGICFQHAFGWQPVVPELVERGSRDPMMIVEMSMPHTRHQDESPVPFAMLNILLRTKRRELAKEIADRWIDHPMQTRAVKLGLTDDLERRRSIRDEMRELYVDHGAPREWDTFLASCAAQCEETDEFTPRMMTNYGLSPLNTPLITEVPRPADGSLCLYFARAHDERNVVWSFVVAASDEEAAHWAVARADPDDAGVEVRRLYSVGAKYAGFCFPASSQPWLVERSVEGVGVRNCSDWTGMAVRRHFYESLHRSRAEEIAMFDRRISARVELDDAKRDWPVPPPGSRLTRAYREALETGLFA